ncbi:MarR family transcriptional regulator [Jeotgalibacillus sp. S-D1]|uniref:MarR family transcriptional regulator n=1 Tax=Jeotgalibacillus sp. S-D1 TaxID=2552189 RepID=UPI00105A139C|nr:MarR family transcriptional regulator [Jeotgalibacillus sp. S-D1]TDL31416.1 MarR family transcriptional regulator [Jeotgalibacillus sp. S-D1]
MDSNEMDSYLERLQNAYETTVRKLGNDLLSRSELGVTRSQYYILYLLSKQGFFTVSDLAEKLEVKPSAVTVMIDRLYKINLVKRDRDESDRRIVKIGITSEGIQFLERAKLKRNAVLKDHLSRLDDEELQSFVAIFEKIAK